MRIGIFTDTYYPCINGVSASTLYYAEELALKGHHVFIFCPRYKGTENELGDFSLPGVSVLRCPSIPVPTNPEHSFTFPGLGFGVDIKTLDLDVIHVQSPFIMGSYGSKIAKKYDIPLTQTYHTLWEHYYHYFWLTPKLFKKIIVPQNRDLCNRSLVNFVPSPQIEEVLRDDYKVTSKLVVCPTGVDIKGFEKDINHQMVEDHLGIPKDKRILLFASRMCKEKSVDVVLKAFPRILEAQDDVVLVLSGNGPFERGVKRLIKKLKIEDKVILKDYLSRGDLYAHYKAADLFIFPSISETQGLVVLEAQYFHTPVVGVAQNGVAMLMEGEKGGLLAKERDPEEVAQLSIKLLKDKALYEQKAREAHENASGWQISKFVATMEKYIIEAVEAYKASRNQPVK